jgi:hypothetical protein
MRVCLSMCFPRGGAPPTAVYINLPFFISLHVPHSPSLSADQLFCELDEVMADVARDALQNFVLVSGSAARLASASFPQNLVAPIPRTAHALLIPANLTAGL